MEPGRSDELDAGPPRQLGELGGIPAAIGRHRVDGRAEPGSRRVVQLESEAIDVGEEEVRVHLDRTAAIDHEVLVGVGDAEVGRLDVAEYGPNEAHGASGDTDVTDQPPSILRSCPVTVRDSSDRK